MEYRFCSVRGHYEVVDSSGKFVLSADSLSEAERELDEILSENPE